MYLADIKNFVEIFEIFLLPNEFLQNIGMRWLHSFWGPELAHFGPLDGLLSIDLKVPLSRLKLGRISTLTKLSFT